MGLVGRGIVSRVLRSRALAFWALGGDCYPPRNRRSGEGRSANSYSGSPSLLIGVAVINDFSPIFNLPINHRSSLSEP